MRLHKQESADRGDQNPRQGKAKGKQDAARDSGFGLRWRRTRPLGVDAWCAKRRAGDEHQRALPTRALFLAQLVADPIEPFFETAPYGARGQAGSTRDLDRSDAVAVTEKHRGPI